MSVWYYEISCGAVSFERERGDDQQQADERERAPSVVPYRAGCLGGEQTDEQAEKSA